MGKHRKTSEPEQSAESDQVLWALGEQSKLLSELRRYAVEFADANPDNLQAQEFAQQVRKATAGLNDATHAFRQALGITAREVREAAERETRQYHDAMRPDVVEV
jgi:hypothetical protein